jgi:methionyl-tRNA synthetase
VPIAAFVDAKAARYAAPRESLDLSTDDFIRTSIDPRHRPGVERLWRACAAGGDLYQRDYDGLYCLGCESFVSDDELVDGFCAEHGRPPEHVVERNWFFALSRYEDRLLELLESGWLRIEPEHRRNEVLGFVRGGLADFSVSRPRERARGWGIGVPDDLSQVVYVWFDALGNYVTALDYGGDGADHRTWWRGSDERVHVVGKGITRFHAVYWPAVLLSAGEPLPTSILVHDYLTANGRKLSKSAGPALDPLRLCARYGSDALRWWFVRDIVRSGDTDVREELVAARANELAGGWATSSTARSRSSSASARRAWARPRHARRRRRRCGARSRGCRARSTTRSGALTCARPPARCGSSSIENPYAEQYAMYAHERTRGCRAARRGRPRRALSDRDYVVGDRPHGHGSSVRARRVTGNDTL